MNMATMRVAKESVITIETDVVLDLCAFEAFVSVSRIADTSETSRIEVDLAKTLHIRDSGLAMLHLLGRLTRWTYPIRLVNWDPVIHRRLLDSRIGAGFELAR